MNNKIQEKDDGKLLTGFACAINCMDGRVQGAVKNYIKENYKIDYVDMVTEPGPNKILAENPSADKHYSSIFIILKKNNE